MSDNVLSTAQQRTLACVLDGLIPPGNDGRLPGAGQLGLGTHIEEALRANPDLGLVIPPGLAAADEMARGHGADGFADLSQNQQLEVLTQIEPAQPAFIPTMMFHLCIAYYQHPAVLEGLGLEPRPPHPDGYEMGPDDLTLLEPVRRRGRIYRDGSET